MSSGDNYLQSILSASTTSNDSDLPPSQSMDHDPATCTCFKCQRQRRREGLLNKSHSSSSGGGYLATNDYGPLSPLSPSGSTQSKYSFTDPYPPRRTRRENSEDSMG